MLSVRPISFRAACAFIRRLHRHHPPPQGCKFAIAAFDGDTLVAVATAGRPVARNGDDGATAEITRVCSDGTPNACSFIYAAVRRVCQAMGYRRIISSITEDEPGTSLRAAGFAYSHTTTGGSWSRTDRPRDDKHPTGPKKVFEWPPKKKGAVPSAVLRNA